MGLGEPLVGPADGLAVDAGEGLVAADAPGGELEHRLEDHVHGVLAAAQQRLDLAALVRARGPGGQVGGVATGLAAAGVLGRVERGVGALEQLGGLLRVVREGGDPGRRLQPPAPDLHVGERGAGAIGGLGGRLAGDAGQDEHELLAAEPADGVARADDRAQLCGGGRERLVALRVAVRVVDALEVVEVDDGDAERRAGERGGLDLAPQPLLRAAVVEQPGEPVGGRLAAQVLALAGGLVRERGHRGEALDERDLRIGEGPVGARAVDVEGADDAVVGQQRDADERLIVLGGPGHDGADRVEARVGDVARGAVAHDPAGRAAVDRQRLGHDLVDPGAEREHGPQRLAAVLDLVDREVVVRQKCLQMVRDPPQRVLQGVSGQDPGCGIDEGVQRSAAPLRRRLLGDHIRCIDLQTRHLDTVGVRAP